MILKSNVIVYMKMPTAEPPVDHGSGPFGAKAISPFALPVVKKRRLFEDKTARSSCALDRQNKWAADGPGPVRWSARGGIMPFGSASTPHCSLCPLGHGRYIKFKIIKVAI